MRIGFLLVLLSLLFGGVTQATLGLAEADKADSLVRLQAGEGGDGDVPDKEHGDSLLLFSASANDHCDQLFYPEYPHLSCANNTGFRAGNTIRAPPFWRSS